MKSIPLVVCALVCGAGLFASIRADTIVLRDGTEVVGTIANHDDVSASALSRSHIGILVDGEAGAELERYAVTSIDYIVLIDSTGYRRVIDIGTEWRPAPLPTDTTPPIPDRDPPETRRPARASALVFPPARLSFGPGLGVVGATGDLGESFSSGWSVGGEVLAAVGRHVAIGLSLSHTWFTPEDIFERAGLDLDLGILHVGPSVALLTAPGKRARFMVLGGIGLYRAKTTLTGRIYDPKSGITEDVDLSETSSDLGLDVGVGVSIGTEPKSAAIRIVGHLHSIFDKETIDGETYGPTEYFRLSVNLDFQAGFVPYAADATGEP